MKRVFCLLAALWLLMLAVACTAVPQEETEQPTTTSTSATTTSAFTGIFLSDHRTREEFMNLISHKYR